MSWNEFEVEVYDNDSLIRKHEPMPTVNDPGKVIKGLECCLAVTKCGTCPYNTGNDSWCGNNNQLLEDALALLKAMEPVKPVYSRMYNEDIAIYACGACGKEIGADCVKYCPHCGQAVKWE